MRICYAHLRCLSTSRLLVVVEPQRNQIQHLRLDHSPLNLNLSASGFPIPAKGDLSISLRSSLILFTVFLPVPNQKEVV